MDLISDFRTNQPISIWASGKSKNDIKRKHLKRIKKKTFSIGINFFNLFEPDARFWTDRSVTDYMDELYKEGDNPVLMSRPNAFRPNENKQIRQKIDYFFDESDERKLPYWRDGHFTFWKLLLMLRNYTDNDIYVFGLDCKENYSVGFKDGELKEEYTVRQALHLEELEKHLLTEMNINPEFYDRIYNCNMDSGVKVMKFFDYKDF